VSHHENTHQICTVAAVHQDVPSTAAMTAAVDEQIAGLAAWLELGLRRAS
jgi:hypothetical protein